MKGIPNVRSIALITNHYQNLLALMESALSETITRKILFAHHGETSAWESSWCFMQRLFFENNLNRNDNQARFPYIIKKPIPIISNPINKNQKS